uniref:Reverse transcriptase domain-containing protein n=1 Tax=Tanacetum cinerariifolium TaxID=118510 RepID=A0A6L2NAQ7_TANCI|nr:hypothetical protein [Tanacetum cinerariifolium]
MEPAACGVVLNLTEGREMVVRRRRVEARCSFLEKLGIHSIGIWMCECSCGDSTTSFKEPSYNQNYNDNYYPHESPTFPCCDNYGGSHKTFQCQPMDQNTDFFGSDQIQTLQYPEVHPPSQEKSDEVFQAKGDLMKSIQTFLEEFNCIPFEKKPQILLEAWFKFFAIKRAQPENSNELFQKLLEDLKELAEYKESLENSSKEIAVSNSNQEKEDPPQDSDIRQLIREECCVEVSEEQKQKMEDTILDALNFKLFSINSNSQRLDKKKQEVKNVVEQPVERGNRSIESLQNFRVIHESSNSLNNTSQISLVHAIAPILSTEEPEHSLSMGYEHLSITPEMESDEVTESNAKNLLPIPSEYEVTLEDESECDMSAKNDCSPPFTTFSNPFFKDNDDLDSSNDESLPKEDVPAEEFKVYSNPFFDEDEINSDKLDPHCFNVESDFVESLLNRDTFIDSSSKFDFSGELAHVNPEIPESDFDFKKEIHLSENLLYVNSTSQPSEELNADEERIKREHAKYLNRMEMFTINPRPRPTMNANPIIEFHSSLPIPVQDIDSQREEIDIVTETDDVLPPSVENEDSEGEIDVIEELLSDNSITFTEDEASDSDYQDDPSVPQPLPEPPDAEFETDSEKEIPVVMNEKDEFDDDYFPFMFVIRIFLPYLFCSKMFISFLSVESEDTIFDPGISV